MAATQTSPNRNVGSLRRFRYLLDIVILIVAVFALEAAFAAVYSPKSMKVAFTLDALVQMVQVAVAWLLIRLRGETLAAIGLMRPKSWGRTLGIGVAIAFVVFVGMFISEKMGFRRDLSRFNFIHGNLELTVYGVFYALIGAGFYEEFMFRGFLMQGVAMLFGGSHRAWIAACIVQAVAFGVSHSYQNPLGMLITGTLGFLLGLLVYRSGPNLWAAIIAHGLYDASRFVSFYFQAPPTG